MTEKKTKPVSASSRISSRDDVWRDIRDWAKPCGRTEGDDDEEDGGGDNRAIGSQIKDNVTEQRLLESRLLDLSKERYKFIVQVAWQRKAFMDKQKRKTSVMKDLMKNVDVAEASAGVQKGKNYRTKLTEKLDTYRHLVTETYSEQRKLEMQKQAAGPDEMKPIIPGSFEPIYKTEPTFSARSKRRGNKGEGGADRSGSRAARSTGETDSDRRKPQHSLSMFPAIQSPERSRLQSGPPNLMRSGPSRTSNSRASTRLPDPVMSNRSGTAAGQASNSRVSVSAENLPRYLKFRSVYDGRFKRLERSLSATYDGKTGPSIESILNGLPSRSMSVAL